MLTKRRRTTPERQGEPSKKQRRAANNLAIRTSMYNTGVAQSNDGGKSLTKPGSNQMH